MLVTQDCPVSVCNRCRLFRGVAMFYYSTTARGTDVWPIGAGWVVGWCAMASFCALRSTSFSECGSKTKLWIEPLVTTRHVTTRHDVLALSEATVLGSIVGEARHRAAPAVVEAYCRFLRVVWLDRPRNGAVRCGAERHSRLAGEPVPPPHPPPYG
uniref:Uncharacterized protein n=1 Tax=Pseudo-nitzschia australis TaxID=44445 RepID=A0A7S4EQQ5_9STRA